MTTLRMCFLRNACGSPPASMAACRVADQTSAAPIAASPSTATQQRPVQPAQHRVAVQQPGAAPRRRHGVGRGAVAGAHPAPLVLAPGPQVGHQAGAGVGAACRPGAARRCRRDGRPAAHGSGGRRAVRPPPGRPGCRRRRRASCRARRPTGRRRRTRCRPATPSSRRRTAACSPARTTRTTTSSACRRPRRCRSWSPPAAWRSGTRRGRTGRSRCRPRSPCAARAAASPASPC